MYIRTIMTSRKKILILILFFAAIIAVRFSPLADILTFDNMKRHRDILRLFVEDHYWLSAILFITIYILFVGISFPGAEILTIPGGYLFGAAVATIYVNIGATLGAILAFLSARYLLGRQLQEKYAVRLNTLNDEIGRHGVRYLLTLRLIPIVPFCIMNFLCGLTKIPLTTFMWTTSLGIVPGTFVYAFAGRQLGTVESLSEILSREVMAAFAVLALFAVFPVILNHLKTKRRNN
jgi:uncharacterized membrane protein YdjX (TVP38/TMEM64 family)